MNRFITLLTLLVAFICPLVLQSTYGQGAAENIITHAGDKLNPAYLEKRRAIDELRGQRASVEQILKEHPSPAGVEYDNYLTSLINNAEHELSSIPMYPPQDSGTQPTAAPSIAPPSGTQDAPHPEVISRSAPIPAIGNGKVTIAYHAYVPAQHSIPEPVESGGGIAAYCWIIYPESSIELMKKLHENDAALENLGLPRPTVVGDAVSMYSIKGTQEDETGVAEAVRGAHAIVCGLAQPAAITVNLPAGRYYVDYWVTLHNGPRSFPNFVDWGPRSVNRRDGTNWGPFELMVAPGTENKIDVTPYGDNWEFTSVGQNGLQGGGVSNLINYGDRLGP